LDRIVGASRSQFVTLKRGLHIKYLPYVFTEYGAIMVATELNSLQAIQMSVSGEIRMEKVGGFW